MDVGQAFAVAFGLAALILGGMYILVRSEQAATQHRENPAGSKSQVWLLVHHGVTTAFVGLALSLGTWFLLEGFPNRFFAAGVALWFYASALRHALGGLPTLRAILSAHTLAGILCAIGSGFHGGPIGIVGLVLSLVWSVLHFWMLKKIWGLPNHDAPMSPLR